MDRRAAAARGRGRARRRAACWPGGRRTSDRRGRADEDTGARARPAHRADRRGRAAPTRARAVPSAAPGGRADRSGARRSRAPRRRRRPRAARASRDSSRRRGRGRRRRPSARSAGAERRARRRRRRAPRMARGRSPRWNIARRRPRRRCTMDATPRGGWIHASDGAGAGPGRDGGGLCDGRDDAVGVGHDIDAGQRALVQAQLAGGAGEEWRPAPAARVRREHLRRGSRQSAIAGPGARQLGRRRGSARRMAPGRRARLRPRILRGPEDAEGGPLPRDGVVVRTHPGPRRRLGHPAVTRLDETARGVFPISATPFSPDGALDLESLDRLVDFYLARRVHGLTLLGIMGEAPKLTPEESRAVVRRALARVAGRVPVVVGVSSANLLALAALANDAMAAGAAGVMVAPTPGIAGDDALVDYMASVFAALDPATPVVYQDYPQSTGVPLTVEAFPRLVMLKHEDCPGLTKLGRIRAEAARTGRRRVSVLVGNNAIYYPQELARGADGAMTGFSYPEMLVEVYERFAAGGAEGAEDVFDVYLPLLRYEAQPGTGLAVRKELLFRRGALASPAVRTPGLTLTAEDHREIDGLVARLERRLKG